MTASVIAGVDITFNTQQLEQAMAKIEEANRRINNLEQELEDAEEAADDFGKMLDKVAGAVKVGAAAMVTAIAAIGVAAVTTGDKFRDLNRQAQLVGVGIESLQELQFAAKSVGIEAELVTDAMKDLSIRVAEATEGSGDAAAAFKQLGLNVNTLIKLPADKQLKAVQAALRGVTSESEKLKLADTIAGPLADILPLLNLTAEQMDALGVTAKETGIIIGQDNVNAILAADAQYLTLVATLEGVTDAFVAGLAPALTEVMEGIDLTNNGALELGETVGEYLVPVIKALTLAMSAFIALKIGAAIGTVIAGFTALGGAAGVATAAVTALNVAIRANPIGLAVSAALAAATAFGLFGDEVKSTKDKLNTYAEAVAKVTSVEKISFSIAAKQGQLEKLQEALEDVQAAWFGALVPEGALTDDIDRIRGELQLLEDQLKELTKSKTVTITVDSPTIPDITLDKQVQEITELLALSATLNDTRLAGLETLTETADRYEVIREAIALGLDYTDGINESETALLQLLSAKLNVTNEIKEAAAETTRLKKAEVDSIRAALALESTVDTSTGAQLESVAQDAGNTDDTRIAALEQSFAIELEMMAMQATAKKRIADIEIEDDEERAAKKLAIEEQLSADQTAVAIENARKKADFEKTIEQQRLQQASGFFGNLATLTQSGSKKLAAIGKAAAVAQATIDGFAAVQKALASAPPPLNFALAGAVGLATAVNIKNIVATPLAKGGVLDSPQLVGTVGGNPALAGEAGPEAVLPLGRDDQGRLGVRSTGSGVSVETVSVTINGNANAADVEEGVYSAMMQVANQQIASANRLGNLNNPVGISEVF